MILLACIAISWMAQQEKIGLRLGYCLHVGGSTGKKMGYNCGTASMYSYLLVVRQEKNGLQL